MSLFNTIRNTIVPVHKEGYPFIAAFFVASLILGWLFKPLFWIGLILTLWCAYFFRDPERMTPQDDDLVISPADGKVSSVQMVVPPVRAQSRRRADAAHLVFMNVFNCHVNRAPMRGRIADDRLSQRQLPQRRTRQGKRATTSATASSSRAAHGADRRRADRRLRGAPHPLLRCSRTSRSQAGERFGLIRFGSRLDVFLPAGAVAAGDARPDRGRRRDGALRNSAPAKGPTTSRRD